MVTRKLPYYEFADGIYEIDEFDCVSVFVIVGSKRALVIDCGTGIGDLRWVIENKITDKPYDVVATHNHGDHIGGAGFFDSIYIHPADMDWDSGNTLPTVDFRKSYAKIIAGRADKHYDYNLDEDVRPWPKTPEKLPLTDGQVFELGDRTVTAYHCPGHTFGEMVFLDDKTKTLLLGDACNCNYYLAVPEPGREKERIREAKAGLERLLSMKDKYDLMYNSHHDFRGFCNSLYPDILEDAVHAFDSILDGTATYISVTDPLDPEHKAKTYVSYGRFRVAYQGDGIENVK